MLPPEIQSRDPKTKMYSAGLKHPSGPPDRDVTFGSEVLGDRARNRTIYYFSQEIKRGKDSSTVCLENSDAEKPRDNVNFSNISRCFGK